MCERVFVYVRESISECAREYLCMCERVFVNVRESICECARERVREKERERWTE